MEETPRPAAPSFLAGGGETGARLRATNWSRTPLGSAESWPRPLKTAIITMLVARQPAAVVWQSDLINFYNDACAALLGDMHPAALGRAAVLAWRGMWDQLGPALSSVIGTDAGVQLGPLRHAIEREGRRDERSLVISLSPVPDVDGGPGGVFCMIADETPRAADERAGGLFADGGADMRTRFETVVRHLPIAVMLADATGRIVLTNPAFARLLRPGITADNVSGMREWPTTHPDGSPLKPDERPIARALRGELVNDLEILGRRADGSVRWISLGGIPIRDGDGKIVGAVGFGLDIDEAKQAESRLRRLNETLEQRVAAEIEQRTRLEDAFRQAQKMEAIGQLTGGVAHDFNNLLTVIIGNLEALERRLGRDPRDGRRLIAAAMRGAERAATLTQRLLAFSRRQPLQPKPVNLNRLVAGLSDLLRRTLGEAVGVETDLAGGLWWVSADANQLESAILNLAVNARDAMPGGGTLTLETANVVLDEADVLREALVSGQYVMIDVHDTGVGMSEAVVEKAFEPFFTTKEVGQGTGLGLSQVYGFIKQSGGHVVIDSAPGRGTSVKLYLPRLLAGEERVSDGAAPRVPKAPHGETVLIVEDDEDVRAYGAEILRELGYRVCEASDGAGALELLENEAAVRLLFTDVGLPGGVNGSDLADEARRLRPDVKVLFTTGYSHHAITRRGQTDAEVELIVKPFSYAALGAKIREILDDDPIQ